MSTVNSRRAEFGLPPLPFPIGWRVIGESPPEDLQCAIRWMDARNAEQRAHRDDKKSIQALIIGAFEKSL